MNVHWNPGSDTHTDVSQCSVNLALHRLIINSEKSLITHKTTQKFHENLQPENLQYSGGGGGGGGGSGGGHMLFTF